MLGYISVYLVIYTYFTILILDWRHFSDIHISQGSVATCLRRGGIFKRDFVANLLPSPQVKKVWKSVNIWWSYGQEFGVLFFWLTVQVKFILVGQCYSHISRLQQTLWPSCTLWSHNVLRFGKFGEWNCLNFIPKSETVIFSALKLKEQ